MARFRQTLMFSSLILIIALVLLSIYGAFLGAVNAQLFFSSLPLSVFWCVLCLLPAAGLIAVRKLTGTFGLLFIHLGCVLVLAGAMYGSQAGHRLRREILGTDKICRGQIVIEQGRENNQVLSSGDGQIYQLPFSIRLNEFKIEYYESGFPHVAGAVRDYISDIAIIKDGKTVARKNIEVNYPLHYGGYYFYQQSYDEQDNQYTILAVVSDSGLSVVYSGYLMLGTGVFWHFWLRHLFRKTGKQQHGD